MLPVSVWHKFLLFFSFSFIMLACIMPGRGECSEAYGLSAFNGIARPPIQLAEPFLYENYKAPPKPRTLDEAVAQVQKMNAAGRPREEIARFVTSMVDDRVTNANSLERMTDWRNWFLLIAENPRETEFDRFRATQVFDYDETARWLWESRYAQCEENSSLTYYILKRAGVEGNVRILTTSARSGHNFVVWGIKDGADPNNPDTWGSNAFVVDGWGGNTLSAEDAKNNSLYYEEHSYITDTTNSYDKDVSGWEVKQTGGSGSILSSLFGCFIATAVYGSPEAEEIALLRQFRDEVLLSSWSGNQLTALYYRLSPPLANYLMQNETARNLVRDIMVEPLVRQIRYNWNPSVEE